MFKPQQIIRALFAYCLLIAVYKVDIASAATAFCPDPLNIQGASRADAPSTSAGGVVTCAPATLNCGRNALTGAGICTTATAPTGTTIFLVLAASAAQTAPADYNAFTSAQGIITSCWNPAANAIAAIGTTLSATNAIMACYTSSSGTGSPIFQTVGASGTASPSTFSTANAGSYCFTTQCNIGVYKSSAISSHQISALLFLAFCSSIVAALF